MIELRQATLHRGSKLIFSEANIRLFPGWHVGVSGENGAGKSSLFSLLKGTLQTDWGELALPAAWTLASMEQEVAATDQLALDYVLDGDAHLRLIEARLLAAEHADDGDALSAAHADYDAAGGYVAKARASTLMAGLGFKTSDEGRQVQDFSGGWRMRLGLARALMCRSDLLLLDEPTNHLDLDALLWLEDWLKSYPGLLLLIAHDRDFLDAVCQHMLHLADGELRYYAGNYSAFERARAERMAQQEQMRVKQERERAHLQSFVDRFRAQATKARQAQSRIKRLEKLQMIAPLHADSPFRFEFMAPERMPQPLLDLEHAATGYGQQIHLQDINLQLAPGDRFGLLGRNGAGKSTLMKLLAGELSLLAGKAHRADGIKLAYFHQHQVDAFADDDTPMLCLQRMDPRASELNMRQFLGGFGFSGDHVYAPCGRFSGGERARLALALCVYSRPHLLLLDEPTNHLDIDMRLALNLALQAFEGAVVLVSHDRTLLSSCCERFLLVDGGAVTDFAGDIDDYAAWLRQPGGTASTTPRVRTDRREEKRMRAEKRQQKRPMQQRLQQLETELAQLNEKDRTLSAKLHDESLYLDANKAKLLELIAEAEQIKSRIQASEAEWLQLSDELDQHATS